MIRKWMTAFVAIAGISGCKVARDNSSTQSLDNFARSGEAALHDNKCEGNYKLVDDLFSQDVDMVNIHVQDATQRSLVQSRIESALRAVPTEIQVAYFGLGGIIEVTPQAHAICSQNLDQTQKARMAEGGSKIRGCWKHQTDYLEAADGTFSEDPRVVMYIDTELQSIEHAMVRTFGYVLSQVLVKLDHDVAQGKLVNVKDDAHFAAAKEQITLAFLKDVAKSGGKYSLDSYADMIGKDVVSSDDLARRSGWDALTQGKPQAASSFMDYVFAESFDSFYCSPATKKIMTKDFPETSTSFAPVAESIDALSSELSQVNSEEELANLSEKKEEIKSSGASSQDQVEPSSSVKAAGASLALSQNGYGLFIGQVFRGVGRVVGGVARGTFRVARGVVTVASRTVVGAARVVGRVTHGTLRIGAAVVRGAGKVAVGIFRGAARVTRGLVVGTGRVVRGAARLTLGVGRAIVRGTGYVVRGLFGAHTAYATERGMVLEKVKVDRDGDGVEDIHDLCSNTPHGARVHMTNPDWLGCTGGQFRDRDLRRGR